MTITKMLKGLRHAKFIGENYSKDPRTKVGALILRADGTPVSWDTTDSRAASSRRPSSGTPRGEVQASAAC
jgi:deoxycytidylate deaminase